MQVVLIINSSGYTKPQNNTEGQISLQKIVTNPPPVINNSIREFYMLQANYRLRPWISCQADRHRDIGWQNTFSQLFQTIAAGCPSLALLPPAKIFFRFSIIAKLFHSGWNNLFKVLSKISFPVMFGGGGCGGSSQLHSNITELCPAMVASCYSHIGSQYKKIRLVSP